MDERGQMTQVHGEIRFVLEGVSGVIVLVFARSLDEYAQNVIQAELALFSLEQ